MKLFGRKRKMFASGCAVALLTTLIVWIKARTNQPTSIRVGDTKAAIISHVGQPTAILTNALILSRYGGEVWVYGKTLDLRSLLAGRSPLKFRLFAPDQDDFVIVF